LFFVTAERAIAPTLGIAAQSSPLEVNYYVE